MLKGRILQDLPRVLIAKADLDRREAEWENALISCDKALNFAAPRLMKLDHADALVMRGRIHFNEASSNPKNKKLLLSSQSDTEEGLLIARDCDYVWTELEASILLADIYTQLGEKTHARVYRQDAMVLKQKLTINA